MKKYKLIKEYPASPPLGTILRLRDVPRAIANYPEFWQPITYQIIEADHEKITIVKRLSDGELFSVGDKTTRGTIESLKNKEDGLYAIILFPDDLHSIRYMNIEQLEKANEPILKTEDGVNIYRTDGCWELHRETLKKTKISYIVNACSDSIYFAYEENADKYIDEHKKQFSKNDIREAIEGSLSEVYLQRKLKL